MIEHDVKNTTTLTIYVTHNWDIMSAITAHQENSPFITKSVMKGLFLFYSKKLLILFLLFILPLVSSKDQESPLLLRNQLLKQVSIEVDYE